MVTTSGKQHSKVLCILCNGLITMVEEEDRFALHMKSLHGVFFNLEFLLAACHMDEDEKDAVIGVMKTKIDEGNDSTKLCADNDDTEDSRTAFNYDLKIDDFKIKKVTVDLPIYKIAGTPVRGSATLSPPPKSDQKYTRTKIFICHLCNKEFPAAFQSLANHKIQFHKMSRRDSQVITMKYVRYEDIPLPPTHDSKSSSTVPKSASSDLSDLFTDIFRPKSTAQKGQKQVEHKREDVPPVNKIKREPGAEELYRKKSVKISSAPDSAAVTIKQERHEELEAKEMERRLEKAVAVEYPVDSSRHQVKKEVEAETPRTCVLCNTKISSESNLRTHMARRHSVPEERIYLFDDGGKGLFRATDTKAPARNTCKLCDENTTSLGMLWNHYKKQHNMSREIIKSLMTKVRCDLCFSYVTFIADHYRTFHKDREPPAELRNEVGLEVGEKENKSGHGEIVAISGSLERGNKSGLVETRSRSGEVLKTPIKDPAVVPSEEKTPRKMKMNEAKLAEIWGKHCAKQPAAANTNWSNIFDFKSSQTKVADLDNIFSMEQEKQTEIRPAEKNVPATNHDCKECGKRFQSQRILRNHLMFHRTEIKSRVVPKPKILKEEPNEEYHFCDYCDYSSVSESDFKTHVEREHRMEVDNEERKVQETNISEDISRENFDTPDKENSRTERMQVSEESSEMATSEESGTLHENEYVEKLIDKLKDIDDDSEEDEDDVDESSNKDPSKSSEDDESITIDDETEEEVYKSLDLSGLPTVLSDSLKSSEYFSRHRGELSVLQDERKARTFTADPPLGPGWRVRYYAKAGHGGSGSIEREFLSPHHVTLSSPEAVVEYILCSNSHTQQSVSNIKHYLGVK